MKHLFGPVPSQRLGISLGIDPIPRKVCSFNCVYCEVARTSCLTLERREYIPTEEILQEIREWLAQNRSRPDFFTFSGSGEPTLHSGIGKMIAAIKEMTDTPVAVITNGSTLFMAEVRKDLLQADVVLPSLDAARADTFRRINRPFRQLNLEKILFGLKQFRQEYSGQIWLEILLVKGLNDSYEEFEALEKAVKDIRPDKIQITTVTRPSGADHAEPVSYETMTTLATMLGPKAEVAVQFSTDRKVAFSHRPEQAVRELLKIRACSLENLTRATGLSIQQLKEIIQRFAQKGELEEIDFRSGTFYRIRSTYEAGAPENTP
jgi:wyosine [tRNA(Phe)-imidazoG37] synthetase (radical SAM superfamily)